MFIPTAGPARRGSQASPNARQVVRADDREVRVIPPHRRTRAGFVSVWRRPMQIALLTSFGLVAALLGTGLWHWLSWMALGVLLIVAGRSLPACWHRADSRS